MTHKFSAVLMFLAGTTSAWAGNSYVLPDGISRSPAVTLHCATSASTAVACGTAAEPVVVTQSVPTATAANQTTEITTEQNISQSLGTQSDPIYSNGPGSIVSLLKGLNSLLANGISSIPVGGQLVSRTVSIPAGTSTVLFSANASRRYLGFQAPQGVSIWVNLVGGVAAPNAVDCAYFPANTFYESGQFVNRGSITIYSTVVSTVSAWEG